MESRTIEARPPTRGSEEGAPPAPQFRVAVVVGFLVLHVLLVLAMGRYPQVARLHFLAVAAGGTWAALTGRVRLVLYLVAYALGSEVLWRATNGSPYYEGAKYLASGIMILSLLRFPGSVKLRILPILFFLLFLPSVPITMETMTWAEARDQVSFYLAGLFTLATGTWYFQHFRLGPREIRAITLAVLGPVVAIGAMAARSTLTAPAINFIQESNRVTSGGWGPNQVASMMGMGAFLAFLMVLDRNMPRIYRGLMFSLALILSAQSALTFSRGGLLTAFGAAVVALLFQFRDRRSRLRILASAAVVYAVATLYLIPMLDAFTGGEIIRRFRDVDLGSRTEYMDVELEAWKENPVFGLGPGGSKQARYEATGNLAAAHTEVSRIVAEHGLFGAAAIAVFGLMGLQFLRRQRSVDGRAWCAGLLAFTVLYSMHSALRIGLPALGVALAAARLHPYGTDPPARSRTPGVGRPPGLGESA